MVATTMTKNTLFSALFLSYVFVKVMTAPCQSNDNTPSVEPRYWSPQGVTHENWIRCRGMPCNIWDVVKLRQLQLKKLLSSNDPTDMSNLELDNDTIIEEDPGDFDGCIWLTGDQIDDIIDIQNSTNEEENPESHHRQKRKITTSVRSYPWSMPIHYKFDGAHSTSDKEEIRGAVSHWEENTCVRFKEIGTFDTYQDNHIIFTKGGTGCHSYVGKISYKPQQINLDAGCIYWFGIMAHEIGHALGYWHEQQRTDRDNYIRVLTENLGTYASQYYIRSNQETYGVEYDTGSVMHYAPKDGSISFDKNVMETLDPLYQHNMGQRTGLSFNDAKLVNLAYCQDTCKNIVLSTPCKRGGYQDPNNCHQCKCPPGFGGVDCSTVATSNSNCGGIINLSESSASQYIRSPNYNENSFTYYDNNLECNWLVKAPANKQIQLSFEDKFNIYCATQGQCFHWVEVKYKGSLDKQGPRFCCSQTPSVNLVSDGQEMMVIFRSNFTGSIYYRGGFKAKIELVGNDQGVTDTSVKSTTTATTTTTTVATTQSQTPSPNEECIPVDLSFLLDSSGSVMKSGWDIALNFVNLIIEKLQLSNACARLSIVTIGNDAQVKVWFSDIYNTPSEKANLIAKIKQLKFLDEWTNTGAAFEKLLSDVYKPQNGDRKEMDDVTILITDGNANKGPNVVAAAKSARNGGIGVIGIGIEPSVDKQELEDITGDSSNIIYSQGFESMVQDQFVSNLISKLKALSVNTGPRGDKSTTIQPTTIHTTTTQATAGQYEFHCTFETSGHQGTLCGITQSQDDVFQWTLTNQRTPSSETGPASAFNGDYYIFIEASNPRRHLDNAIIELEPVPSSQLYCLSFNYHMYGHHINTLNVYKSTSQGVKTIVWQKSEQQGNKWFSSDEQKINMATGDKILFEGIRGEEFSGDIALDNILLRSCN